MIAQRYSRTISELGNAVRLDSSAMRSIAVVIPPTVLSASHLLAPQSSAVLIVTVCNLQQEFFFRVLAWKGE